MKEFRLITTLDEVNTTLGTLHPEFLKCQATLLLTEDFRMLNHHQSKGFIPSSLFSCHPASKFPNFQNLPKLVNLQANLSAWYPPTKSGTEKKTPPRASELHICQDTATMKPASAEAICEPLFLQSDKWPTSSGCKLWSFCRASPISKDFLVLRGWRFDPDDLIFDGVKLHHNSIASWCGWSTYLKYLQIHRI